MLLKSYFLGSSMQFHADDQYGKFLDRFRNYLATRERGKGGGVTMFVKNNISFKRREGLEKSLSECIWIEIYVKHSKSFLVGCFYRPPETSKYLPKSYNRLLQNLLETIVKDNKETIIVGDFNVNYNEPNENVDFKRIINQSGFKQVIKKSN